MGIDFVWCIKMDEWILNDDWQYQYIERCEFDTIRIRIDYISPHVKQPSYQRCQLQFKLHMIFVIHIDTTYYILSNKMYLKIERKQIFLAYL